MVDSFLHQSFNIDDTAGNIGVCIIFVRNLNKVRLNAAPRRIQESQVINQRGSDDIHNLTGAVILSCLEVDGSFVVSFHSRSRQAGINCHDFHHTLCVLLVFYHLRKCPKVCPVVKVNNALVIHTFFRSRNRKNTVLELSLGINLRSYVKEGAVCKQNVTGEEVQVKNVGRLVRDPRCIDLTVKLIIDIVVESL